MPSMKFCESNASKGMKLKKQQGYQPGARCARGQNGLVPNRHKEGVKAKTVQPQESRARCGQALEAKVGKVTKVTWDTSSIASIKKLEGGGETEETEKTEEAEGMGRTEVAPKEAGRRRT